jgi:hypothetical protein
MKLAQPAISAHHPEYIKLPQGRTTARSAVYHVVPIAKVNTFVIGLTIINASPMRTSVHFKDRAKGRPAAAQICKLDMQRAFGCSSSRGTQPAYTVASD